MKKSHRMDKAGLTKSCIGSVEIIHFFFVKQVEQHGLHVRRFIVNRFPKQAGVGAARVALPVEG